MLRVFILSLCLIAVFTQKQSELDNLLFKKYQKFLTKFEKSYPNMDEMNAKFAVFKQNYLKAKLKAAQFPKTEDVKSFGTTEFMDMTEEEFSKNYLTLNQTALPNNTTKFYFNQTINKTNGRFLQNDDVPESWDWTERGAVNPIRNQGLCGGCWAFSAVSNMESQYYLKTGVLPKLSEQQLIDCDPLNSGCSGGIMHNTFTYIKYNGIQSRDEYPYQYTQGICRYNPLQTNLILQGYLTPGSNDEESIKEMLYRNGPLSITINASLLQYYTGGVFNVPYEYCPYAPNHGVNLVGYGVTKSGLKYWKVRNTWGSRWGEGGYFRIARGAGLCGVNMYVISALLN
jgi:cathepsin F